MLQSNALRWHILICFSHTGSKSFATNKETLNMIPWYVAFFTLDPLKILASMPEQCSAVATWRSNEVDTKSTACISMTAEIPLPNDRNDGPRLTGVRCIGVNELTDFTSERGWSYQLGAGRGQASYKWKDPLCNTTGWSGEALPELAGRFVSGIRKALKWNMIQIRRWQLCPKKEVPRGLVTLSFDHLFSLSSRCNLCCPCFSDVRLEFPYIEIKRLTREISWAFPWASIWILQDGRYTRNM